MWIMTERGFYSVVAHRENPRQVLVRARVREDLERLLEMMEAPAFPVVNQLEIQSTPAADYPYRVYMPRLIWEEMAVRLAAEIDYPNFKDRVAKTDSDKLGAYHEVWAGLQQLEKEGVR